VTREALVALIVVGVVIAFFDGGLGASLIAVAAGALVAAQVTISLVHYRRVMRRPWPAVHPVADDDDDW
jgi:predicted signal transduction protein with EAL and GGDEF domain